MNSLVESTQALSTLNLNNLTGVLDPRKEKGKSNCLFPLALLPEISTITTWKDGQSIVRSSASATYMHVVLIDHTNSYWESGMEF